MARLGFWQGRREDAGGTAAVDGADAALLPARNPAGTTPISADDAQRIVCAYEEDGQGWFWSTDADGCIDYLSGQAADLIGADPAALRGRRLIDLVSPPDDEPATGRTLSFLLARQSRVDRVTVCSGTGGARRWWSLSGVPQFTRSGQFRGYCGHGIDISEQRRVAAEAARMAMHDPLTGLPNRLRMAEVLAGDLAAFEHQRQGCAVMLIDLDRFKQVNDTLGHMAGDALLRLVAARLRKIVGEEERVFRLGGDEFQIVVRNGDPAELAALGERIIAALSQPYTIEGSRCIIGTSIGAAIAGRDGHNGDELIRNADLALYAAKGGGRGRIHFYEPTLLAAAADRRALEEDLRDALARGQIELFYQPVVSAGTNCATGVEALIRWHHPVRGYVSPAVFIPIAEEANLIAPLGEWVMRKACEDAARWPGNLRVAVNVSPIQFTNESLPAIVMSALANSGLPPERLELEITEGVFLSEGVETDSLFATLKDIGVRLALDDFGTGYSSLGYLRTAPFDKIKIDQSFVRAATLPGSRNRAIISAIVALAEALGMETTAEGIESLDQLDLMRTLRVSHIQGYVYSKPIPGETLAQQIDQGDWIIAPAGPSRQRSERHSMYRTAGAIFGNHYRSVLIRNLSQSGALVEGLDDLAIGSQLIIDFGEGQLAFGRVRRSRKRQQGIEFEEPLIRDDNGGFATRLRISPYQLQKAGLPTAPDDGGFIEAGGPADDRADSLEQRAGALARRNEAAADPAARGPDVGAEAGAASGADTQAASPVSIGEGAAAAEATRAAPAVAQLAERHLAAIRGDARRHAGDAELLRRHILPRFGRMSSDTLVPSQVAGWIAEKARGGQMTLPMISRLEGLMGQLYLQAMQWNSVAALAAGSGAAVLGARPGGDAGEPGPGGRHDGRDRALSPDEIVRLKTAVADSVNPQLKNIVALLMLTGTRQRELLAARWADIDLAEGSWSIPDPRGGGHRTIRLSAEAQAIIRDLPRFDCCPSLIANPVTKRPYRSFASSWDAARRKAGLADVELDDLRHCAVVLPSSSPLSETLVKSVLSGGRQPAH